MYYKTNRATRGAKVTKEKLISLSRNSFELLQIEEDDVKILSVGLDVEVNTNRINMLRCTDSYGENRAWNLNEDKDT